MIDRPYQRGLARSQGPGKSLECPDVNLHIHGERDVKDVP